MGFTNACVFVLVSALFCQTVVYCASISLTAHASAQSKPKGYGSAKRAVIVGIDGFGGSHFRNSTGHFPALRSFMEQGSHTTRARGVFPTKSGPNWATSLTGLSAMQHGVFSNSWTRHNANPKNETSYSIPPVTGRGIPETMFRQVKKKDLNLQTAMMFTWPWLKYFAFNNSDIDVWHCGCDGVTCDPNDRANCYHMKDTNTMVAAAANLAVNEPILTFIHLDAVDFGGHVSCWGCATYYRMLKSVDMKIKFLLDELKQTQDSTGESMLDGTLIMIISDHGGWRDHHDYPEPFSALVDIPILIRGPDVLKNNSLEGSFVSILDVVPTALNAIGVDKSEFMRGQVLEQIYP